MSQRCGDEEDIDRHLKGLSMKTLLRFYVLRKKDVCQMFQFRSTRLLM